MGTPFDSIPGVAAPVRRALEAAGYRQLEDLDGVSHASLRGLHGMGDRSLQRLQTALTERGLSLADAPPAEDRRATITAGHTGTNAPDLRTSPAPTGLDDYLGTLDARRRAHADQLLELFGRATGGAAPVLWGESMIGYGQVHYRYATGREGDTFRVGFSPRRAKLSLYGLDRSADLLERLGKHTVGVACLYVNKPEDVRLDVLEEMVRRAWEGELRGWA